MKNTNWDIVIVGGGFSASLLAIDLIRNQPQKKILILEASAPGEMAQKVGESSSDLQAIFLRRFKIDHLLEKQVKKTGLRFVFKTNKNSYSEFSSPSYRSIANGFQLNRKIFDEDLLNYAQELGVHVLRSTKFLSFQKNSRLNSILEVKDLNLEQIYNLETTWLIDATGRLGLMAKKLGWRKPIDTLLTAASWAYYETDVSELTRNWDVIENKIWDRVAIGEKAKSTTHFMGKGYWAWYFPIDVNKLSFGIVYDETFFSNKNPKQIYHDIIASNDLLNQTLGKLTPENFKHLSHLAYTSHKIYEPGVATLGDAAAFIDPLFSPGMELNVQQLLHLSMLLRNDFELKDPVRWNRYEKTFLTAIETRKTIYEGRYAVMGEFDLFTSWTQLDFLGYLSFHVLPSAYFPGWIKNFPRFNFITRFLYQQFKKRLLKISKRRSDFNLVYNEEPKIVYSGVRVPQILLAPAKICHLLWLWIANYLKLEAKELLKKS